MSSNNPNETQSENTQKDNINEPYIVGLCNCGCGGRLQDNGGILNQDGTRRKYIKYHHLKDHSKFKPPQKHSTKKSKKSDKKEIRELKRTVDSLMKIVQDSISLPRTPPPPLPTLPVVKDTIVKESVANNIGQNKTLSSFSGNEIREPSFVSRPVSGKPRIPEGRHCVYCKSTTTYAGPNDNRPKWYMANPNNPDAGYMCNSCNNIRYRLKTKERRNNGIAKILEEKKLQQEQQQPSNARLDWLEKELDVKIKVIVDMQDTLDLRKKDIEMLEREITDTVNKTRTMLQNKDDIIKAQSDSFVKLEEKYREMDNQFGIKYREWEKLTERVSELEVLNQNIQSQLDRRTQDLKSATNTLVYHLNKVINLESKLRILQKEKEAWVKLRNDEDEKKEKDKDNEKNKPVVPLTFKPIQ